MSSFLQLLQRSDIYEEYFQPGQQRLESEWEALEINDGAKLARENGDDDFHIGLVTFSIFRSRNTGEYAAIVRDKRDGISGGKKVIVDYKAIDAQSRPHEDIMAEARQVLKAGYAYLTKFLPLGDRKVVEAMHAAEANEKHPKAIIFKHFPAFMHAYQGQAGFFKALNDIYGPEGNDRSLRKAGVRASCWGGWVEGGELGEAYTVTDGDFIQLYEKMGRKDQDDFSAALTQLRETVLVNMESSRDANATICIDLAVEHGSGIIETADFNQLFLEEQHRRMQIRYQRERLVQTESVIKIAP